MRSGVRAFMRHRRSGLCPALARCLADAGSLPMSALARHPKQLQKVLTNRPLVQGFVHCRKHAARQTCRRIRHRLTYRDQLCKLTTRSHVVLFAHQCRQIPPACTRRCCPCCGSSGWRAPWSGQPGGSCPCSTMARVPCSLHSLQRPCQKARSTFLSFLAAKLHAHNKGRSHPGKWRRHRP